jgi:hypothetical protein
MPNPQKPSPNNPSSLPSPPHWSVSLWIGLCCLLILALALLLAPFFYFVLGPALLLFLLSLLRPKTPPLPDRLEKVGLAITHEDPPQKKPAEPAEEETENFWSKRTFND